MTGLVRAVMQSLRGYADTDEQRTIQQASAGAAFSIPLTTSLAEIEKLIIRQVLQEEQGNRGAAAERLNIGRTTLWRKLKD